MKIYIKAAKGKTSIKRFDKIQTNIHAENITSKGIYLAYADTKKNVTIYYLQDIKPSPESTNRSRLFILNPQDSLTDKIRVEMSPNELLDIFEENPKGKYVNKITFPKPLPKTSIWRRIEDNVEETYLPCQCYVLKSTFNGYNNKYYCSNKTWDTWDSDNIKIYFDKDTVDKDLLFLKYAEIVPCTLTTDFTLNQN